MGRSCAPPLSTSGLCCILWLLHAGPTPSRFPGAPPCPVKSIRFHAAMKSTRHLLAPSLTWLLTSLFGFAQVAPSPPPTQANRGDTSASDAAVELSPFEV